MPDATSVELIPEKRHISNNGDDWSGDPNEENCERLVFVVVRFIDSKLSFFFLQSRR